MIDLLATLTAAGLDVDAGDDYATHGRPYTFAPEGTVIHHTGSYNTSLHTIYAGYDGLPGPLAQIYIETRPDSKIHLVSNLYCNHAGRGNTTALARTRADKPPPGDAKDRGTIIGNRYYYGIELEGPPIEPWSYNQAVTATAAIHNAEGWSAARAIGHREWTSRKPDPQFPAPFDMNQFRADVARRMTELMSDHTHTVPPDRLPRAWADVAWAKYLARGGSTIPESRVFEVYREDIAWHDTVFVAPLEERIAALEAQVAQLQPKSIAQLQTDVANLQEQLAAIHTATRPRSN